MSVASWTMRPNILDKRQRFCYIHFRQLGPGSQVVRRRSAKPLFTGSIPVLASIPRIRKRRAGVLSREKAGNAMTLWSGCATLGLC